MARLLYRLLYLLSRARRRTVAIEAEIESHFYGRCVKITSIQLFCKNVNQKCGHEAKTRTRRSAPRWSDDVRLTEVGTTKADFPKARRWHARTVQSLERSLLVCHWRRQVVGRQQLHRFTLEKCDIPTGALFSVQKKSGSSRNVTLFHCASKTKNTVKNFN